MLKEIGKKALLAAEELKTIDTDTKNKVLNDMASELINDADEIIEANKIDLAVEHFESIKRSGVSVDVSVYNALIDAHCKRFNMVEAVSIVKYMEEVGTSTNFKTFEILLEGAYASKSVEVAQTFVLEKIKEDANSVSSKTIGFAILTFASVASVGSFVELNNLLIENLNGPYRPRDHFWEDRSRNDGPKK